MDTAVRKIVIVGLPGTIDARLATSTLFDLLGDPGLWSERFEVLVRTNDGEGLADWVVPIQDGVKVIQDFDDLDAEWVILGPTQEDLVLEAMAVGAKYLALDDGLVELQVEDELPAVEVIPDTQKKEEEEVTAEAVVEPTPEVEAPPVKRGRGRPRKNPLPADLPAAVKPKSDGPKLAAAPAPVEPSLNGDGVKGELRNLINALLADADTEKLWKTIDSLR